MAVSFITIQLFIRVLKSDLPIAEQFSFQTIQNVDFDIMGIKTLKTIVVIYPLISFHPDLW